MTTHGQNLQAQGQSAFILSIPYIHIYIQEINIINIFLPSYKALSCKSLLFCDIGFDFFPLPLLPPFPAPVSRLFGVIVDRFSVLIVLLFLLLSLVLPGFTIMPPLSFSTGKKF